MGGGKRIPFAIVVIIIIIAAAVSSALATIKVNPATNQYVDEFGRTRIFHGVNAVYKSAPFYPPELDQFHPNSSLCEEDMLNLHDKWGFNVVRLYIAWQGVVPQRPGDYNTTYINMVQKIVKRLESHGIYVILDAHQDVASPFFCGEGFPDWAVIPSKNNLFPYPVFPRSEFHFDPKTQYPLIEDCLKQPFFKYYLTVAASEAFQNLYDNVEGIQGEFARFWRLVAANFGANFTNLLGYELLNEPFVGAFYKDPSLLIVPGHADKVNLVTMYKQLYASIRQADPEHIIFYEPMVTDMFKTGFDTGPGGPQDNDKQSLSHHIYCNPVNNSGDPRSPILCHAEDSFLFEERKREIQRLGGGGFLTEFGAVGDHVSGANELTFITDQADKTLHSWTYWQFKYYSDITTADKPGTTESFYFPDGSLQVHKVKALSRTYAQAICGIPIVMKFDSNSALFSLDFTFQGSDCKGQPTVVFFNQDYYYPNGYSVTISPDKSMSYSLVNRNYLEFKFTPAFLRAAQGDQQMHIVIKPN